MQTYDHTVHTEQTNVYSVATVKTQNNHDLDLFYFMTTQFSFPEDALIAGFVIRYTHICQNQKRNMCVIESWNACAKGSCTREDNQYPESVVFLYVAKKQHIVFDKQVWTKRDPGTHFINLVSMT